MFLILEMFLLIVPIETPHEASSQIEVPEMVPVSPQSPTGQEKGLFGWISGNKLMSKVKVIKMVS